MFHVIRPAAIISRANARLNEVVRVLITARHCHQRPTVSTTSLIGEPLGARIRLKRSTEQPFERVASRSD
ncbi:uncharacterized protein METZ01_LOCUS312091 [marine metagenome]|uniref:Uncharacterized protein n=1 Tax=marine metagenome TaxID=408172 RepID=A0A382NG74_9ZZZZ